MWLDGSLTSGSKVMMQFIFFFQRFCIHLDKNIKWNKVGAKMKKSEGLKYIIICGFIGAYHLLQSQWLYAYMEHSLF